MPYAYRHLGLQSAVHYGSRVRALRDLEYRWASRTCKPLRRDRRSGRQGVCGLLPDSYNPTPAVRTRLRHVTPSRTRPHGAASWPPQAATHRSRSPLPTAGSDILQIRHALQSHVHKLHRGPHSLSFKVRSSAVAQQGIAIGVSLSWSLHSCTSLPVHQLMRFTA